MRNVTAPSPTSPEVVTKADRPCAACNHSWAGHDGIAARFCAATLVNGSTRGCVCGPNAITVDAEVAG